jgi:inhibitor of Bruton tyrosine kinase
MTLLFKYFYDGDVEKFRALLAPAGHSAHPASRGYNSAGAGGSAGSPGAFATSPKSVAKPRKTSGWAVGAKPGSGWLLGKNEVNIRDHRGLTILLHAASSTAENAIEFVEALLEHPTTDLYVQDYENGWNCLHRALYFGNISIARLLLDQERRNLSGETIGAAVSKVGRLIKTKDHDGDSPFDLFNHTVGEPRLDDFDEDSYDSDSDSDEGRMRTHSRKPSQRDRSVLTSMPRLLPMQFLIVADGTAEGTIETSL